MKVLVIGGGGREHALVWKISQSPLVKGIYCVPGNAGIDKLARCVNPLSLSAFANLMISGVSDLIVVGPEKPLAAGIVDQFESQGFRIFGPSKAAAEIEASKVFSKKLMVKSGIPTAKAEIFDSPKEAKVYIQEVGVPIVVKADGLANGKGVFPCRDLQQAFDAVDIIMVKKEFGEAGNLILVEEFLEGEEASFMVFSDGKTILPMMSSQDHKPVNDGDKGLNTGGMGAYSPAPVVTGSLHDIIMETIIRPAINGMAAEGRPYKGVLYAGLIIKNGEPKVLEFNARFGDPESQAVLPRLKSDIVPVMQACIDGTLSQVRLEWDDRPCVSVVMVSGGYPGSYEKDKVISGLDYAVAMENVVIFHAGTAIKSKNIVTNGGRVLDVTALGNDIGNAIKRAYEAVDKISFEGAYFRKDIGYRAINR